MWLVALAWAGMGLIMTLGLLALVSWRRRPRTTTGKRMDARPRTLRVSSRLVRVVAMLVLLGGLLGPGSRSVSGARPRKEIDRSEPLGHDVGSKYANDCEEGLKRLEYVVQELGWTGVEELAEQSVQTIGGAFGEYAMKALDDDTTRGDTASALLGFQQSTGG